MRRLAAAIPGFDRLRLVCLFVLCGVLGCALEERAASFKLREKIPFGVFEVSVEGWERVGEAHAPISSLRAPEGEKTIAVFVVWSGLESYEESDRRVFAEAFLHDRLNLVDADGLDYRSVSAMPREVYDFSNHAEPMPRDWVVVFHVGVESHAYTLRLRHPDPDNKDFDVALVQLG